MFKEKISQEFGLRNIGETRNYFVEEIDQNELMRNKNKKVCMILNYTDHFLILASPVTGRISISVFSSLLGIPIGMSSVIGLTICAITAEIKKYRLIIKKKKKKHDKLVLLAKSKLNSEEVLICKASTDSNISYDEFLF